MRQLISGCICASMLLIASGCQHVVPLKPGTESGLPSTQAIDTATNDETQLTALLNRLGARHYDAQEQSELAQLIRQQQPWYEKASPQLKSQSCHLVWLTAELASADLPPEYTFVPFFESNFNPFAISKAGAAGLWQIMPVTAKSLSLSSAERFHPVLATRAAARLIKQHQAVFGEDALVVLSAYNAGEGSIVRRLRQNYQGRRTFLGLHAILPAETQHYAPRFLIANLQADKVRPGPVAIVEQKVDLAAIANSLSIDTGNLQQLNPALKDPELKPGQCVFLPQNLPPVSPTATTSVALFRPDTGWDRLPNLQNKAQRTSYRIAETYKSNPDKAHREKARQEHYRKVKLPAGASWSWLANTTGRSLTELQRQNPGSQMRAGESVFLPVREIYVMVKPGDSLQRLARQYRADIRVLRILNQLADDKKLKAGQKLRIWL
jgi:membrane-bound lytic murein transglycosylase D